MAYVDNYTILNSGTLKNRAVIAVIKAAHYVLAGGSVNSTVIYNARQAVSSPDVAAARFMTYLAVDATVSAAGEAATDAEIQFVVDAKYAELWGAS